MPRAFQSEVELARKVVAYLTEQQWDVYQEVQVANYGSIADIVAKQGKLLWVIECKLSFGLAVIEQAAAWRNHAHYVSVAVPGARSRFGCEVLRMFGLGMLTVGYDECFEWVVPRLNRAATRSYDAARMRKALVPERRSYAEAGNNNGRRWSPWARTREEVERYVATNPGCTMKELLKAVDTHYGSLSTARSCLYSWIRAGKFKVYLDEAHRPARLYPEGFLGVSEEYINAVMQRHNVPADQMEAVRAAVAARFAS